METLGTCVGDDLDAAREWYMTKIRSFVAFTTHLLSPHLPPQHTYKMLEMCTNTRQTT